MKSFKRWLFWEGVDIFGFERKSRGSSASVAPEDKPIMGLHADVVIEYMVRHSLDGMSPVVEFSNQIRWGEGHGAIEMVISPFGSYKSIIRRMQPDLEGRSVWACKRVIPYKEILKANLEIDEKLGAVLMEQVEEIRKEDTEAPSHDFSGMAPLVRAAARLFQRKTIMPEYFIYMGTREVEKNKRYLMVFELGGQGVEAPGSSRIEQFIVEMGFDSSTGMIRSFGYEVQSPTKGHRWYPGPSEWDETFSSGQKQSEILECLAGALSTY